MKCNVCRTPLVVIGHTVREYRNISGRVYKRIRWPRYATCPKINDPNAHPHPARRP